MGDNPRQFSSIDSSDANLHGSLTNRPASGVPAGDPIDFEALNRQVTNQRTQAGYIYKESTGEYVLRREREIASSLRFKQQAVDAKAVRELQEQQNQIQRNELRNRIGKNTPLDPEVATLRPESPLTQQQRSTPERQPPPSTGRPPPTPNGTAARASPLIEPTATPAPAALAEPVSSPAGGGGSGLFSSLPTPVGRAIIPGAMAAVNFGDRVVHGQPIVQAAAGAGATLAGGVIGTAVAGPIGGLVGSVVGGYVGGAISDWFFQPPNTGSPPAEVANYPPFLGGQEPVEYHWNFSTDANPRSGDQLVFGATGPISDFRVEGLINTAVINDVKYGNWKASFQQGYGPRVTGSAVGFFPDDLPRLKLVRLDNKPDPKNTTVPAPPPDNEPYHFNTSPIGSNNSIPSGNPAAGKNKNNKKNKDVAPSMPGNNTPNGTGFFPGHGGLAPNKSPNPTQAPSNLGGNLPGISPPPTPFPPAEKQNVPPPGSAGSLSEGSSHRNGLTVTPATVTLAEGTNALGNYIPPGTQAPNNSLPSGIPTTTAPNPTPDANSPVPKSQTVPNPKTPEQATTDKTNQIIQEKKKDFDRQLRELTTIATAIAALTPIIRGIPDAIAHSPTVQAANRATTQGAVCEIAQPGGCLGNALDDSANKINQNSDKNANNLLDKINELTKTLGEQDNSKQGVQPPEAAKVKATFDVSKTVSATGLAISDSDKEADE